MSVLVAKEAPDFTAIAVLADGTTVEDFKLSSLRGKYVVLFFYPHDFTFVCPSEILAHHHRVAKFKELGVELVGVSKDSHHTHNAWRRTAIADGGIGVIDFPLVADIDHSIQQAYDVVHPEEGVAMRGSFLIDKAGIVQHQVVNNMPLGRNVDEMLRMVDALQFHEQHGEVCPAGWNKGDDTMKETPESVAAYLAKNAASL